MDNKRDVHMHDGKGGAAIAVRLQPRASHNEVIEIMDDGTVKIRLTAPPVEGKANQALIEFLAELLDISQGQVEIVAGHTGRNKMVVVMGVEAFHVQERITRCVKNK